MKQTMLLFTVIFAFSFLSAQITQEKADEIVLERMSEETRPHTVFANPEIQADGKTITTSTGKQIELDYPCRVYFIQYTDTEQGFYLIVNVNNGNLLQINAINAEEPEDLAKWRRVESKKIEFKVPGDILWRFDGRNMTRCIQAYHDGIGNVHGLIVINSNEEFVAYFTSIFSQNCSVHFRECVCGWDTMPNIDFSKHTVLIAYARYGIVSRMGAVDFQFPILSIDVCLSAGMTMSRWQVAVVVDKITDDDNVELQINYPGPAHTHCVW